MANNDLRVGLKNLAAQQLPEFVRAEYPTFVAFVEAYYEFLDNQSVDLRSVRDIDDTLEEYIKYFKAELAHNYPVVSTDSSTERFLLKHIKDQYLAKGSEASYKLLFRLLYGKDVFIDYPGRQMLRVSDGRWTQDVSIFVKVSQGDPFKMIGKIANIQTGKKIYNTNVVKDTNSGAGVTASVQNVLAVPGYPDIFEIFLDRNFYGQIEPFNTVKYGSEFQATILPCTAKVKINDPGKNFRPGMVFELSTGDGTPFWFKVSTVNETGGLKTIDTIRFGLFYNTNFAVTVLPQSAVSTKKKKTTVVSDLTYTVTSNGKIVAGEVLSGGNNYTLPPEIVITGDGTGALAHAVIENGSLKEIVMDDFGEAYSYVFMRVENNPLDFSGSGATVKGIIGADYDYNFKDKTSGFTESGYVNFGDYWDVSEHGRGAAASCTMVCTGYDITTVGNGYAVDDLIKLTHSTSGFDDIVFKVLSVTDGHITSLSIEDGGSHTALVPYTTSGYSLTNVSSSGSGAKLIPTFSVATVNITNGGTGYNVDSPIIDINIPINSSGQSIDGVKAKGTLSVTNNVVTGVTLTDQGAGYIQVPMIKIYGSYGYANGAYVGTIARQFFINAADTLGNDPANLNVSLEAVAKYPGYYRTNDGFLDDSMMIQDSYYFQAFAYVLKIDEQLEKYASVVRSMLHPSGMALFGEYSINNKINLSIGLTSLVKSLGVTLYDMVEASDSYELDENGNVIRGSIFSFYKDLSTTYTDFTDSTKYFFVKSVADSYSTSEIFFKRFTKAIGFTGQAETVFPIDLVVKNFSKKLEDTTQLTEEFRKLLFTKTLLDFQPITDLHAIDFTLNTIVDPMSGVYPEEGYVTYEPYEDGAYAAEHYSNERPSTFSS